jgi:hypothetical protein
MVTEVTTIPAVVHSEMGSVRCTEMLSVSIVISVSAMNVPSVTSTICGIEVGTSEVEIVTMWVTAIDAEVPVACFPVEWTIEICGCYIGIPLPVQQDVAEVQVPALPVCAENVSTTCHSHQIVEVYLVGSLILLICEVELIGHLVSQEQGLITSLLITHRIC